MDRARELGNKVKSWLKKPWAVPLFVALFVGTIVSFEARSFFSRESPSIDEPRYLVAKQELPAGQPIHFLDFTIAQRSSISDVPDGAITDQEWHLLEGRALRRVLPAKGILTHDALTSGGKRLGKSIPKGYRAYSFSPANSVRVLPGDKVDVLVNPESRNQPSVILLENLAVLQVDTYDEGVHLIAAMTADQIQLLEKGRRTGKLTVALRNPEEVDVQKKSKRRGREAWPRSRARDRIEVWSEGDP